MKHQFLGIDHLGIAVGDLEESTRIYQDVLGFEALGAEKLEDRGIEVRFLQTGNSKIELLGALHDQSEISGFLSKRGPGIHHICVRVDDLQAAIDHIAQEGGRIIGGGIQDGAHNTRVAFVHPKTTSGVLLELVEAPSASQKENSP